MLYVFTPANPKKQIPVLNIKSPGEYEITDTATADAYNARFPGELVPVVVPEVKRGPGRPPKADKAEPAADKAEG